MKRIIITDRIKQYTGFELYPVTDDVEIVTAYSNEDALAIHGKKRAHLIITELYGSGMNGAKFCSRIREDVDLRFVSIIVFCRDNEVEVRESRRCRANAVMTFPIDKARLRGSIQQLISIPARENCSIEFSARHKRAALQSFRCAAHNISVTGMLIEANVELKQGDRMQCSLVLPSRTVFETEAEVVRTEKRTSDSSDCARYGVRFSRLDPAARRAIEAIVRKIPSAKAG